MYAIEYDELSAHIMNVNEMKLLWYGHACRNNNSMSKVIFQGTVNGTKRRVRPIGWNDP